MSQQIIDTGGEAGAGGGDDLFTAFTKINDNFTEIYSGNVVAANILVYSVAGRTGNVVLTAQDVFGAATYSNISVLQANITASLAAANAYTDAQIASLGPLANVTISSGNISNVRLVGSWGTLTNLLVSNNATINGQLTVGTNLGVGNNLTVGGAVVFGDNTQQTTAFQGFGNIFSNAVAQAQAIAAISANLNAVNTLANSLIGNLSIVDTTIYVNNSGAEITLQPDGTGNVYIGQSGANDLVLGKGVYFDDGTYQDTAYTLGEYVTDSELSSNVTALGQRIDAANAAILVNTNRVAAANAQISSLTSTVSAQATSDAANVAAANAAIASTNSKISAANLAIASTNANVTAANAAIDAVESNVATLQSTVAGFSLSSVNANVAAANAQIATTSAGLTAANAAIGDLQADIVAANAVTAGVAAGQTAANAAITALQSNAASQAVSINTLVANAANLDNSLTTQAGYITVINANVSAANAAIVALRANITAANAHIAQVDLDNANNSIAIGLANVEIALNTTRVNAANAAIAGLRANITAANAQISSTNANLAAANSSITALLVADSSLRANIEAANSSISSVLVTANSSIAGLRANVIAANARIASTDANVLAANASISSLQSADVDLRANIAAANSAIALNTSRINAANAAIAGLRANIIAANAHISSTDANLAAANASINSLILSDIDLRANVVAANAAIVVNTTRVHAANTEIAALRANVTAANSLIASVNANVAAANAIIATLNAFDLTAVNANVAAANATIAVHGARITLSNTYINELRANLTASNARISTLESASISTNANVAAANVAIALLGAGNLTLMNANITAANIEIDTLRANITASNVRINRLEANIGAGMTANAALPGINSNIAAVQANVTAANASIADLYSNAAVQSAAIFVLQGNALTQQNEIDGKLSSLNPNATGTLTVSGSVTATGNVDAQSINAVDGYFTRLYGEVLTNAQPFITSLGTLTGLGVQGNVTALGITSTQGFTGQIKTASQPLITGLGLLNGLDVGGSANITGALGVNTITADVAINTPILNATTINGTIGTAAQTNVTSVGNLTALAVDGTTNLNEIIVAGNIRANAARSQLAVNSLSTNSVIAATANVTSLANIEAITGNTATFAQDLLANNTLITYDVTAARVIATAGINGTLETAAQPNVTSLGNLTTLHVTGNSIVDSNVIVAGNVQSKWILANVLATVGTFFGNVSTGNLSAAYIEGVLTTAFQPSINRLGNLVSLNVDGDTILAGNVDMTSQFTRLSANTGSFNVINGYVATSFQPNITTLGTLTGLNVNGTVNVTGDQYISNDLWVIGNIYLSGNTTTVNTGNVTTTDKDLTLANDAISATAARGSGIFVGPGGVYGNITVYDGTWRTPQNFGLDGNIQAANAVFNYVSGTLTTASQPNITTIGTLNTLDVTGNINAANLAVTYGGVFSNVSAANVNTTTVTAVQGDFTTLNIQSDVTLNGLLTLANISFTDGTFQTTTANVAVASNLAAINANVAAANIEIAALQANIASANTVIGNNTIDISTLFSNAAAQAAAIDATNANVAAANVLVGTFSANISTLFSNAATQQTQIDLLNANVTAANLSIDTINANVAAANAIIAILNSVNLGGDPSIVGNLTVGSLKSNGNVETGGAYSTGNITLWNNAGEAYITTNSGNLYINNFSAGIYATPFLGNVIIDANLDVNANLSISANLYADNIYANTGVFNTVTGTLLTAAQPNITTVGTLGTLSVTGNLSAGNISTGLGSFTEINSTGNITAANVVFSGSGNVSNLGVTNTVTAANVNVGNLAVSGSFALTAGSLALNGDISTSANLQVSGNTSLANAAITGDLSAGGNLYITGLANFSSNIQSTAPALTLSGSKLDDNLYTGFITANNDVRVFGNTSTNNFTTNTIVAANASLSGTDAATSTTSGALTVVGGVGIGGNIWTGGNANVGGSLRTTNIIAEGPVYFKGQINLDNGVIETNQPGVALFNNALTDFIVLGSSAIDIRIGDENVVAPYVGQGNTSIRHNLAVSGNVHANNNVIVRSTSETSGSYSGALQVYGGAWMGANVYAGGNIDVAGTGRIGGAAYIGGNTRIDGNTDITGVTNIIGNTTVVGVTAITGNTSVVGNITTSGTRFDIVANTSIVGDTSITGNVTIVAPIHGGNSFAVGGNVSMNANVFVAETLYANSIIAAGGIGIPNIDNTPVGQTTPSLGTFTVLSAFQFKHELPRSNQRPRLMLDFANNPYLDPRIVFARNSIGSYYDTTGNLVVAVAGQPRFTSDPRTNTVKGLLIEESRINYLKSSEDFTNATYWTSLGGSIAVTSATESPTGNFADSHEIVENTDNVYHGICPDATNNQISATITNYYVASAYVKAGGRTQFGIAFANEGGAGAIFDLVTQTITESAGSGGINTTSQIAQVANGWFRISTVVYKQNSSGNVIFGLAENGSMTFAGNTGAVGGYIYGAQLEGGSFATSHIPTTTAAVTRQADDVSVSNAQTFFDNTDGILYVDSVIDHAPTNKTGAADGSAVVTATIRPTFVSFEGATVSDRVALVAENITTPSIARFANLIIYKSGALESNIGTPQTHFTTISTGRVAAYFKSNSAIGITTNGNLAVGVVAGGMASGRLPTNIVNMFIGKGTATGYLNGTISKISYMARSSMSATPGEEIRSLTQQ